MSKKFVGILDSLPPEQLISKSEPKDIDKFFVTLGLIFNDLKGLLLLDVAFKEAYDVPVDGEISFHTGEYSGMSMQIQRLIIGHLNEFCVFLKDQKDTMSSARFQLLLKNYKSPERRNYLSKEFNSII